jgi:hypothetical protein
MDCCVSAGCLGTRIMCLSGLLCQCRMSRNEDNVFEWTVVSVLIILVPRHPALTHQFIQTHYPRSETSGTETTVHSDTLSSFRDKSTQTDSRIMCLSGLGTVIMCLSGLGTRIMCLRGLMSRNEDNVS